MRTTLCALHYAYYTMRTTLCVLHYAYYTMRTILCVLHYAYYTMHTTLYVYLVNSIAPRVRRVINPILDSLSRLFFHVLDLDFGQTYLSQEHPQQVVMGGRAKGDYSTGYNRWSREVTRREISVQGTAGGHERSCEGRLQYRVQQVVREITRL